MFSSSGSLSENQPMQRLQTFQLHFLQDCEREYVYSRITRTHSNLWNVLIIELQNFNYLIHGTNEFSKKKLTILIVWTDNFYSVLFFLQDLSHLCYNSLHLLPVAPCQSKRVTSLSIARWQTVIFVINSVHNNGHSIFVVVHTNKLSFSVMLTGEYHIESVVY